MIELKQFVTATLVQIIEGVRDAQEAAAEAGGKVNPVLPAAGKRISADGLRDNDHSYSRLVEFDIAITSAEETGSHAGIKVFLAGLGGGAGGQSAKQDSSVTRIKFPVPVFLPGQH